MFKLFGILDINYKDKLEHSKNLVKDAFEHEAFNGNVSYDEEMYDNPIVSSQISWIGLNNCYVIQHLRHGRYKILREAYSCAEAYTKNIIPNIVNKIQHYRSIVKQRLIQANIPLTASNVHTGGTEYYNYAALKKAIYNEVKGKDAQYKNKYLPLQIPKDSPPCKLYYGNILIAIGALPSLKYLREIINNIRRDKVIGGVVLDIEAEKLKLENNTALNRFEGERKRIVKQVMDEEKILEGRCKNRNCSFH